MKKCNQPDFTKHLVVMAAVVAIIALGGLVCCLSLYSYLEQEDGMPVASSKDNSPQTAVEVEEILPDSEVGSETSEEIRESQVTYGAAGVSRTMQELMAKATTVPKSQTTADDSGSASSEEEVDQTMPETQNAEDAGDTKDSLPLLYGKGYIEKSDFGGRFKNNAVTANEEIVAILKLPELIFNDKSVNKVKVVYPAKVKKGKTASIKVLVTAESGQQYFTRLKFKAKDNLVMSRTSDEEYDSVVSWNGNRLSCYFVTTADKKLLKLPTKTKYKNVGNDGILQCTFVRE